MPIGNSPARLLQVARFSARPTGGAELRIFHLAARLARHMTVTHLGFSAKADERTVRSEGVEFVPVARQRVRRLTDIVRGALGTVPFSVLNYTRENMRAALRERLEGERPDVVLLESVHLGAYIPLFQEARHRPGIVACDWHNIESEVLARHSDGQLRPLRRLYARHTGRQLAAYERWFVKQCDLHITVSERDRETLSGYGVPASQITVIENGVDTRQFPEEEIPSAGRTRIVYVGAMDAYENVDAVRFFALESWPRIHRELPECVFTIVGRNPAREVRALAGRKGIEVTGSVEDVRPYYREAFAAVAPLRVAGGTRLKILEAMAAGVVVVSTSRGAEGLRACPGTHYLLADDPEGMAAAVLELARSEATRQRIMESAQRLVRDFDWAVLGDRLAAEILARLESRRMAAGA